MELLDVKGYDPALIEDPAQFVVEVKQVAEV